jgi:putative DNA primase/helicase
MIVLVGPQNAGKTRWFRRLLPIALKKYFAQSKFKDGKDSEALMAQKLLILNDELDGMNKNDANTFRNFISQDYYTYRVPFGKQNTTVKRLATVCGTCNDFEIVNDPENNRRMVPIEITGVIFKKYNDVDKDSLLGEVYALYKTGFNYELTQEEINMFDDFAKGYEVNSIERETIQMHFKVGDRDNSESVELTATEIMRELQEHSLSLRFVSLIKLGKELRAQGFKLRTIADGNKSSKKIYDVIRLSCVKTPYSAEAKLKVPWRGNN